MEKCVAVATIEATRPWKVLIPPEFCSPCAWKQRVCRSLDGVIGTRVTGALVFCAQI